MNLSITIAQTQTDATSRPIITHLTSQCACRNSVIKDRSEDVRGSTDWATSPGFIVLVPPTRPADLGAHGTRSTSSAQNRMALRLIKWESALSRRDRYRPGISRHRPA